MKRRFWPKIIFSLIIFELDNNMIYEIPFKVYLNNYRSLLVSYISRHDETFSPVI